MDIILGIMNLLDFGNDFRRQGGHSPLSTTVLHLYDQTTRSKYKSLYEKTCQK